MFKLDPNSGYWRTVEFFGFAETGAPEEHQLRVKFRNLKRSEIKALFEPKPSPLPEGDGDTTQMTDADVCRRVVMAAQGDGIEGSLDEILDSIMEVPNLQEVISTEYFKSLRELREKNLPTPPTTG